MKEFLRINGDLVELTIEIKGKGTIQVNTIIPEFKNGIWKGQYFSNIPINIKAIQVEGSKFKQRGGLYEQDQSIIDINFSKSDTLIANFE